MNAVSIALKIHSHSARLSALLSKLHDKAEESLASKDTIESISVYKSLSSINTGIVVPPHGEKRANGSSSSK